MSPTWPATSQARSGVAERERPISTPTRSCGWRTVRAMC
jgi:hypothetical protein